MAGVSRALIRPMLAVAGSLPAASADGMSAWATEMKWDGVRAVAYIDGSQSPSCQLFSRNDRDITVAYPELASLPGAVGAKSAVLDGEIVAMDDRGRPSFGRLQNRMHIADAAKAARLASEYPVCYLVFDLLRLDGHSLLDLPYVRRRALLEQLHPAADHVALPPAFQGDPGDALAASRERGLEGVVCKRLESTYQPGRRSPSWVKVKHLQMQEVVLVGWEPGAGRREGEIGALLLAVPIDGELTYVGKVGTGFTDQMLADLRRILRPLEAKTSAAVDVPRAQQRLAHWVRPELVGEVVFGEWTNDNRLRHPAWRGLRPDKSVADVVIEGRPPSR